MKAIELLKDYKNIDFGCNMDDLHSQIDEAIKELEELKNRSCATCKYWKTSQLDGNSICKKLFNFRSYFDFCCKNWEPK